MRKPNLKDMFLASKIARKIDIKNANIDFKAEQEEVGGQLLIFLFENLDKAETEICELAGSILEIEPDKLLEMPLEDIYTKLKEIEGLKDFFSSLSKLTKSRLSNSSVEDTTIQNLSSI